jgi:teichuronic acid biosynthesis glycosyltransferase TuaC
MPAAAAPWKVLMTPLRLLTFSTLFPNEQQPNHGIFVENRLRHLLATGEVAAVVLAPVPYFPSGNPHFGTLARYARVPAVEHRHGLAIHHPRYPVIPRVGMSAAPWLLYRASLGPARRLAADHKPDLIDAHYLYPDGVAAVWLGAALGLPVVLTARGSDVTQLPDFATPRRLIRNAIAQAAGLIGVSAALGDRLLQLGAPPERTMVLRNGIDTQMFRPPADRAAARAALGLTRKTLISVGNLIPRKRLHLTIDALRRLPDVDFLIVGEGPERAALQARIADAGLSGRVRLVGPVPHAQLPAYYGAADASVLASSREGWANVLLESMACGTPVVASAIPGNPEVVQAPEAGLIVGANTAEGIADAVHTLLGNPPDRAMTRAYAEKFGWDDTSQGQLKLFRRVLAR